MKVSSPSMNRSAKFIGAPPTVRREPKTKLQSRMEQGKSVITTEEKLKADPQLTPWKYGYGIKFVEQGDGEPKISWHVCPKDLSRVPPGIWDQCLRTPEYRRDSPLFTSDFK